MRIMGQIRGWFRRVRPFWLAVLGCVGIVHYTSSTRGPVLIVRDFLGYAHVGPDPRPGDPRLRQDDHFYRLAAPAGNSPRAQLDAVMGRSSSAWNPYSLSNSLLQRTSSTGGSAIDSAVRDSLRSPIPISRGARLFILRVRPRSEDTLRWDVLSPDEVLDLPIESHSQAHLLIDRPQQSRLFPSQYRAGWVLCLRTCDDCDEGRVLCEFTPREAGEHLLGAVQVLIRESAPLVLRSGFVLAANTDLDSLHINVRIGAANEREQARVTRLSVFQLSLRTGDLLAHLRSDRNLAPDDLVLVLPEAARFDTKSGETLTVWLDGTPNDLRNLYRVY